MNREFLQLAKVFDSAKHGIANWFMSEKLDGMRAYWDGGYSRGKLASEVPYANTAKNDRLINEPIATGLWSRYGNVIHAPDWFLDQLPEDYPLDGELYLGRGEFQELMSTVKQFVPDERWYNICYMIFDSPPDCIMFNGGKINNPNFSKIMPILRLDRNSPCGFYRQIRYTEKIVTRTNSIIIHSQIKLPSNTPDAVKFIEQQLEFITDAGGEGLMLRKPEAVWTPKRTDTILKVKKLLDSEATVLGYTWGKGKLEGLMGAILVKWGNVEFELSGFTDVEREMMHSTHGAEPGSVVSVDNFNRLFPRGSVITFRYSELSTSGIPLKARYLR